jgi:hypothetical protein
VKRRGEGNLEKHLGERAHLLEEEGRTKRRGAHLLSWAHLRRMARLSRRWAAYEEGCKLQGKGHTSS